MANVPISDLPLATYVKPASLFPVVVDGVTDRTPLTGVVPFVSIKNYGAVGDGTTDDTSAINTAIDTVSAAGGGVLMCPAGVYKGNFILKSGVYLVGSPGYGDLASYSSTTQTKFLASVTGVVVDTPASLVNNCGIVGINIQGLGSGTVMKGVRFQNVSRGIVKNVNINSVTDEGLLVGSSSIGCVFEDILATNCLLDRTQSAKIGVIDVDGADHFLSRIESTASQSALSDANAYLCGVLIRGDNMMLDAVIGEISDEGIHIPSGATLNRIVNCRADLNFGHGFNIIGSSNQFSNCLSLNNSQETTNTYDNWQLNNSSANNQLSNCQALSNTANVAKYGFNDLVTSAANKNRIVNPYSSGAGTLDYNGATNNGSAFLFPNNVPISFSANDTTPSISGNPNWLTANSNPTTITNFDNGVPGQHIFVLVADTNTTFQHNGVTITLPGAANIVGVAQTIYHFVLTGTLWRVVGGA